MKAVASVIMNRVNVPVGEYSRVSQNGNIRNILFQEGQFDCARETIRNQYNPQNIYNMNTEIGTLYIPKTKLNTKVYSNPDPQKMEKMPAILYTSGGLNQKGITLIVGHNRRNGKMFSKNKKLSEGDVFYFTDYEGVEKEYTIYSKFITTSDDTSFLNTNVDGPTIALSCCTDASDDNRIIILGRAE